MFFLRSLVLCLTVFIFITPYIQVTNAGDKGGHSGLTTLLAAGLVTLLLGKGSHHRSSSFSMGHKGGHHHHHPHGRHAHHLSEESALDGSELLSQQYMDEQHPLLWEDEQQSWPDEQQSWTNEHQMALAASDLGDMNTAFSRNYNRPFYVLPSDVWR